MDIELQQRGKALSLLGQAIDGARSRGVRLATLHVAYEILCASPVDRASAWQDAVAAQMRGRLAERMPGECIVTHLADREFLVILEFSGSNRRAAEVARLLLALADQPMQGVADAEVHHRMGVGIALFPEDGDSSEPLVAAACAARLRAAEVGVNRFSYHSIRMLEETQDVPTEKALRLAIASNAFSLHYQPKIDLRSGMVTGAEALIRCSVEGLELPERFIPVAERSGLIVPLGRWVIENACRQLRVWRDAGWSELRLAVNVSTRQFISGDLLNSVEASLRRFEISPSQLELELTESTLMEEPEATVAMLHKLKALGVKVSLDDFGTGYSSFSYLCQLPLDTLKIDRAFVTHLVDQPRAAMVTDAIIDLAHRMGLKVIAEGIETTAQLAYLQRRNCDEGQGFLMAAPMPAEAFHAQMSGRGRAPLWGDAEVALPDSEHKPTILLVDDEKSVLAALNRLLRIDGYRILTADSGREGLDILAHQEVDVVLSDQRMPEMTGVEFLGRVKAMYPRTVRMILSGYSELESITAAINEGSVYKFLSKPWDDRRLRDVIEEAFRYREFGQTNYRLRVALQEENAALQRENQALRARLSSGAGG